MYTNWNSVVSSNSSTTTSQLVESDSSISSYKYTGKVVNTNHVNVREISTLMRGDSNIITQIKNSGAVVIYETTIAEGMAWDHCNAGWVYLYYAVLTPAAPKGASYFLLELNINLRIPAKQQTNTISRDPQAGVVTYRTVSFFFSAPNLSGKSPVLPLDITIFIFQFCIRLPIYNFGITV